MYMLRLLTFLVSLLTGATITLADPCNPNKSPPGACKPNVGLPQTSYTIDFMKTTLTPPDWTISNYATVRFGAKGAEFTVAKRFDSPQLWTNFYMFYGKIDVVMQVAPGTGIVSSAVLMSDDMDEIDWEFSGNNFGQSGSSGVGQNNYYGKGIVGSYDRGQFFNVNSPQTQFHTYTLDWKPDSLTWLVDGTVVRTLYAANADQDTHQYPQTPAKFQLGIWAAGDPGNAWGTVDWAGGYTDFTKTPFTTYVKSVSITNYNPAYAYNWTDASGSAKSIQIVRQPPVSSSSTNAITPSSTISSNQLRATTSTKPYTCPSLSPPANTQDGIVSNCTGWYVAKPGDSCLKTTDAQNISMDDFWAWNPAVNPPLCYNVWANYAYCVNTDCDPASQIPISATASVTSTSSSLSTSPASFATSSSISMSTSSNQSSSDSSTIQQLTPTSQATNHSTTCSAVLPPANTQDGVVANCASWYVAKSGDNCDKISRSQGISKEDFMDMNPAVGAPLCYNLWLSYAYCTKACGTPADPPASDSTTSPDGSATTSVTSMSSSSIPTSSSSIGLTPIPSSSLCPSVDGQGIKSNQSNTYTVHCSSDTTQGSFTNARATQSYLDCMVTCDATKGCTAWTYVGGNSGVGGGTCWLKSSLRRTISAGSNFISGVLSAPTSGDAQTSSTATTMASNTATTSTNLPQKLPGGDVSPSATSFPATLSSIVSSTTNISSSTALASASASSCPGINSQNITSSEKNVYTIRCSTDTDIGSYTNARATQSYQDCIDACDDSSGCVAFTYVGGANGIGRGTCWLKNKKGNLLSAPGNYVAGLLNSGTSSSTAPVIKTSSTFLASSTSPISSSAAAAPTRLCCPDSNGTIHTVPKSNKSFVVECGIDHAGGDMLMTWVSSLENCISACAVLAGCVDVSIFGSACYMKRSIGRNVTSNGIQGARLIGAPSGNSKLKARGVFVSSGGTATSVTDTWGATPKPPPNPPYDGYFPRGGRWQWNGHGHWDWVWN